MQHSGPMDRGWPVLSLFGCFIASLSLISCPNRISDEHLLRAKDTIPPEITITCPVDGSCYASTVLVSGTATDSAREQGDASGSVAEIGYQVLSTSVSGTAPIEGNAFSFVFSTDTLSGTLTVQISATDWNGNRTDVLTTLAQGNGGIPTFTATPGNRTITLTWDPVPLAESYTLYFTRDNSYPSLPDGTNGESLVDVEPEITIEGAKNGHMHVFRLRAHMPEGYDDAYSEFAKAIPLSQNTLAPHVSTDRKAEVQLWWYDMPADTDYVLYRADSRDGPYYQLADALSEAYYSDRSVTGGVTYYYRVQPEQHGTLMSIPVPGRTTPLEASPFLGYLQFAWDADEIGIDGGYAYLGATRQGLVKIDISDPRNPVAVGECDYRTYVGDTDVNGVAFRDGYAYVANLYDDFVVVDTATMEVAKHIPSSLNNDIYIEGDYAYGSRYNMPNFYVYDVSVVPTDPLYPKLLAKASISTSYIRHAGRIFVDTAGDRAYQCGLRVAPYGVVMIDISGAPTFPTLGVVAKYDLDAQAFQVVKGGNYLYIASEGRIEVAELTGGPPATSFAYHSSIETGSYATDLMLVGDRLYAGVHTQGIFCFTIPDLADPSGVVLERAYRRSDLPGPEFDVEGDILCSSDDHGGFHTLYVGDDLFDLAESIQVDYGSESDDICIWDSTAYATVTGAGLQILDISQPFSPQLRGTAPATGTDLGVCVRGDLAFLADSDLGLRVIDVSDPDAPAQIGSFPAVYNVILGGRRRIGVAVVGDYLFLPSFDEGILVLDVSDPTTPLKVASMAVPDPAVEAHPWKTTLFAPAYRDGLYAFDISDPEHPELLSVYSAEASVQGVDVEDDVVYLACWADGVRTLDYTDPSAPVLLGHYIGQFLLSWNSGMRIATDVEVVGDYAFVTSYEGDGVRVLNVSDPHCPFLQGFVPQSGASALAVYGEYLFVPADAKYSTPPAPLTVYRIKERTWP